MKKIMATLLAICLLLGLAACGSSPDRAEPDTADKSEDKTNDLPENPPAPEESQPAVIGPMGDSLALEPGWAQAGSGLPNDAADKAWTAYQDGKAQGMAETDLKNLLVEVQTADPAFAPAYAAYAELCMDAYVNSGDESQYCDALNALSRGYENSGEAQLQTMKEKLGWASLADVIARAEEALKNNDYAGAFEIINEVSGGLFGIRELSRILMILNHFNDSYYYLITGPTAGHSYIMHFKLDGSFRRVKMNENGLYDSGTYTYDEGVLSFLDLRFFDRGGEYAAPVQDDYYGTEEYVLRPDADGSAKSRFEEILNAAEAAPGGEGQYSPEDGRIFAALLGSKWQTDPGSYFEFYPDGSGKRVSPDMGLEEGFDYFPHPEKESAILISMREMPDELLWFYNPAEDSFLQETYGFDVNTDSMQTFKTDVSRYKG